MKQEIAVHIMNFLGMARSCSKKETKKNALAQLRKVYDSSSEEDKAVFAEYFSFVLEPTISFGVKWFANVSEVRTEGSYDILPLLRSLETRELTGYAATTALEICVVRNSEAASHLLKLALDKSLDCGISRSSFSKTFPEFFLEEVHMMKCEPATTKTLKNLVLPAIIQLKADGIRFNAIVKDGKVEYITYNGNRFTIDDDALNSNLLAMKVPGTDVTYLDGEIVFMDDNGHPLPRRTSNGLALKLIKGSLPKQQLRNLNLVIWDVVTHEMMTGKEVGMTNWDRFIRIVELLGNTTDNRIQIVETKIADTYEDIDRITNEYIEQGLEGSIVKNIDAFWEPKRSKQCFKFKAERECELVVVGTIPGNRKYVGVIGSLVCESSCGKLSVDVSGMTDEERTRNDWIGKIITVRYNEVIESKGSEMKSLFLPRIVEVRFDKNTADDLETILKN